MNTSVKTSVKTVLDRLMGEILPVAGSPFKTRQRQAKPNRELAIEDLEERILLSANIAWVEQGPHGTINGQLEFGTQPNERVTGAIHTVLAHPTDADTLYIGGVNGGIWKTEDATSTLPAWTPQTDQLSSLAIGALEFDLTDATYNTLVAGTAKYSSFAGLGGTRGQVYRTTDGGSTWVQLGGSGVNGQNISGIAARGNTIVLSSSQASGGIFRSTDGGATFSPISSADFNSPGDDFTDLVVDESDPTGQRLYTTSNGVGGSAGIYRSDNFGASWTKVTGPANNAELDDLLGSSNVIEMAVHPTTGRIFAAVLVSAQPRGVFYSDNADSGAPTWTQMDVPILPFGTSSSSPITGATNATPIEITSNGHGLATNSFVVIDGVLGNTAANGFHRITVVNANTFSLEGSAGNGAYTSGGTWTAVTGPSPRAKDIDETAAQGRIHFSIGVDPNDEDLVFIGGDRQDRPNSIGDSTFGGAVFRGDATIARNPNVVPSPQWDHLTHDIVAFDPDGGTANGTAPHADSREITFDANGNLIEADDGGIFRRTSPGDNTGDWFSLAGNLGVIEFHDVAYDSNSGIIIGGTQDNGTHFQQFTNGLEWDFLSGGDGGDVSVDAVSLAASGQSIRYSSFQNLGAFRRTVWDANNNLLGTTFPNLNVTSGAAIGVQFKTPVEINAVDPDRLLFVGSNGIYESPDQGANIAQIGGTHSTGFLQDATVYGGFQNGVPNPDVFYVGVDDDVRIRTTAGGAVVDSDPDPGSSQDIKDVVMHSDDWSTAWAIDSNSVMQTTNAGASWTDITGNLMSLAGASLFSVEYVAGPIGALVVGGNLGVFTSLADELGVWNEAGTDLPNVAGFDLQYDATDDILIVGTLGRGVWSVSNASSAVADRFVGSVVQSGVGYGDATGFSQDTIAPDKQPLLPGETASYANYTNYFRGLNRVFIDVGGLEPDTVSNADFTFRVGNTADPSVWPTLPTAAIQLPTISVVEDVTFGVDRVVLAFTDNQIQNAWLQITVEATPNTGLAGPATFYFGNQIGDSFGTTNPGENVKVNAFDTGSVRLNQSPLANSVGITNVYDVDRSGTVNSFDTGRVRLNQDVLGGLLLFTAPGGLPPEAPGGSEELVSASTPPITFTPDSLTAGRRGYFTRLFDRYQNSVNPRWSAEKVREVMVNRLRRNAMRLAISAERFYWSGEQGRSQRRTETSLIMSTIADQLEGGENDVASVFEQWTSV